MICCPLSSSSWLQKIQVPLVDFSTFDYEVCTGLPCSSTYRGNMHSYGRLSRFWFNRIRYADPSISSSRTSFSKLGLVDSPFPSLRIHLSSMWSILAWYLLMLSSDATWIWQSKFRPMRIGASSGMNFIVSEVLGPLINLSINWVEITSFAWTIDSKYGVFMLNEFYFSSLFSQRLSKIRPTIIWLSPTQMTVPD